MEHGAKHKSINNNVTPIISNITYNSQSKVDDDDVPLMQLPIFTEAKSETDETSSILTDPRKPDIITSQMNESENAQHHISSFLQNLQDHTTTYTSSENKIKDQIEYGRERISTFVSQQLNYFLTVTSQHTDKLKDEIHTLMETSKTLLRHQLDDLCKQKIDNLNSEIQEYPPSTNSQMHKRSKLFPNVDPQQFKHTPHSKNPFETNNENKTKI
jgi:ElaB/YqjD/DUF883 family membrane-anchored ribosome-binding protein